MADVPSKHVWKIKESCYVYATVYSPFLMPKVVFQKKVGVTGLAEFLVFSAGSQKVGPNNPEDTLPW